jgi:hypothetical protein
MASTCSRFDTSQATPIAVPPAPTIAAATFSAASPFMSITATLAPSRA